MQDRCEPLDWNRALLPGADLFDDAPVKGTTCTSTPRQRATSGMRDGCGESVASCNGCTADDAIDAAWLWQQWIRADRQWQMSRMSMRRLRESRPDVTAKARELRDAWVKSWPEAAEYFGGSKS